jgi:hypothetical protein
VALERLVRFLVAALAAPPSPPKTEFP